MSDIRELAMRICCSADMSSHQAYSHEWLEHVVRAAVREGMSRAANTCKQVHRQRADAGRKTGYNAIIDCEEAIRAEADKMEGK